MRRILLTFALVIIVMVVPISPSLAQSGADVVIPTKAPCENASFPLREHNPTRIFLANAPNGCEIIVTPPVQ